MQYSYREATDEDYEFARVAHHAAYQDVVTRVFGSWVLSEQDVYFDTSWDVLHTYVLLQDDVPCGYFDFIEEESVYLRQLVINPEFQKQGAGSWVLKVVKDIASTLRKDVTLRVFKINQAKPLYERAGFVVEDETEHHYLMRYTHR